MLPRLNLSSGVFKLGVGIVRALYGVTEAAASKSDKNAGLNSWASSFPSKSIFETRFNFPSPLVPALIRF